MKTELGTRNKEIFVSLLRKAKRKHLLADVTDNKKFWKRVKPLEIKSKGIQTLR